MTQTRLPWLLDEVRQIFENAFFVVFFFLSRSCSGRIFRGQEIQTVS